MLTAVTTYLLKVYQHCRDRTQNGHATDPQLLRIVFIYSSKVLTLQLG